ncbi:2Fe-2S iron-sulfur cluster-binding protein [Hydrogenophaga intermedia]|uniref:2Fe-2S iron-sulfur cluster-binding protein n=1 Tax=Hydrogenophaga intermedia TaxID=65786 RepID=UPI002043CE6F|nr:2Fe-2S iron-sulfur cluster-binding protein [Hydrogenophaga intermedia]MCM3566152.1 FAD-binding oxidoreductase [Hydrogenophaga intermedia]
MSFQIHVAGSEFSFPCGGEETILDAALKAGIELPYSCRKGVCGNCAAKVNGGEVSRGIVNAEAVPEGQELLCQCRPLGNLEIAPSSWRLIEPGARQRLKAKVFRHTLAAPDVSVLQLRLPAGQRARFRAGQYLQVLLADGSRRAYSMANAPHESDGIQLHIRHVAGGQFTQQLSSLQSGDELEVELPFGQVAIDPGASSPLVCVCGGTGFAPVKSLLDDLSKRRSAREIALVWGGRDRQGLYMREHVGRWQRSLPGLHFLAAIEDANDAIEMQAFHGRVDAALATVAIDVDCTDVYCCGAPPMVNAVKTMCLQQLGMVPERFHSDVFAPGPAP